MQFSPEQKQNVCVLGGLEKHAEALSAVLGDSYQVTPWRNSGSDRLVPMVVLFDSREQDSDLQSILKELKSRSPEARIINLSETSASSVAQPDFSALLSLLEESITSVTRLQAYIPEPALEAPQVHTLSRQDFSRWDAYVEQHPEATFFHKSGWKVILENAYGHDAPYLYATRGGKIVGILPLGHIQSRLFGNTLISTPFCVYGGVVADDEAARKALEEKACALADNLRVDHLEFRYLKPVNENWPRKDLYVTFRKPILPDIDANMKEIPRKQRRVVRQGIEFGLQSEIDHDVERFFHAYAESLRNLGTPVHSKRYFQTLKEVFGEACEQLIITHGKSVHCAVMSFYFRNEVSPYYGGGGNIARSSHANDFMYWELMRRACERGFRSFDFGRSKKGVGSYDFKRHWGFSPEPLNYEIKLLRGDRISEVNPLNPKYQLFIAGWKKLPLFASEAIGPCFARSLG